jgi:hypothetical protein
MTTWITVGDVLDIINRNWESDLPDSVLEVWKQNEGKPLTKRILAKLPGGEDRWRFWQTAGMTNLEEKVYSNTNGNNGLSLLLAHRLTNITIDSAELVTRNTHAFAARKERNAKRENARAYSLDLAGITTAINAVRKARAELAEAESLLETYTGYGCNFSPDSYDIKALCDIDKRT